MNRIFKFSITAAIGIGWLLYYPYIIWNKSFDVALHLPFHLCSVMEIVVLYACVCGDRKLFEVIAYPLIIGPVLALSFPTGTFDLGGWHAIYFVYYHLLLISSGAYILVRKKFAFGKSIIWKSALFIFACDVLAFGVNHVTGGNYMFIGQPSVFPANVYYPLLFLLVWVFLVCFHFIVAAIHAMLVYKDKQHLAQ